MKALITIVLGSLSLASGGVAMLYLNGHNIFNMDVWVFAVMGVLNAPIFMLDQAISGETTDLIRGVLITILGISMAAVFGCVAVILSAVRSLKITRAAKKSKIKESHEDKPKKVRKVKSEKEKKAGGLKVLLAKIMERLSALKSDAKKRKEVFKDEEAVLDDDMPVKKSFVNKIKERIDATKNKKKNVVIVKSGNKEEAIIEVKDDVEFLSDLKEWYASIKNVPQNDKGKIDQAKALEERATKRVRAKIVEEDAMNGEFMLRMMDAWANKKEKTERRDPVPIVMSNLEDMGSGDDTFSRAIHDVMTEGVGDTEDEDDEFGIEDIDDEDDDFIIHDIDEGDIDEDDEDEDDSEDFSGGFDISDEDQGDILDAVLNDADEESETANDASDNDNASGDLKAITTARYILDFMEKAENVANFDAEWEDELEEVSDRKAYVEEMFSALLEALETEAEEIEQLSSLDAEGDAREIDWLQENLGQLEDCKQAALDAAKEGVSASEDADYAADLEEEFGIGGGSEGSGQEDQTTDFDDEIMGVTSDDEDRPELDEDAGAQEEEVAEDSNDADLTEVVEDAPEVDEVVEAASGEGEQEVEDEEEKHEPKNVTLAELDEIEKSDELIYNWALVAKSAGAAEAKISHSVIAKDGLRRRVVGITHLVAAWRGQEKDESRRLNILLRYVPEGEWSLNMEDYKENGIKMVDKSGDFVQVSAEMIAQPEIENGVLLVHFYGPGAVGEIFEERENLVVTNDTLSVDKIREKMIG